MISLDRMETLLHYTLDEILKAPQCMADGIEFRSHRGAGSGGDSHASCF